MPALPPDRLKPVQETLKELAQWQKEMRKKNDAAAKQRLKLNIKGHIHLLATFDHSFLNTIPTVTQTRPRGATLPGPDRTAMLAKRDAHVFASVQRLNLNPLNDDEEDERVQVPFSAVGMTAAPTLRSSGGVPIPYRIRVGSEPPRPSPSLLERSLSNSSVLSSVLPKRVNPVVVVAEEEAPKQEPNKPADNISASPEAVKERLPAATADGLRAKEDAEQKQKDEIQARAELRVRQSTDPPVEFNDLGLVKRGTRARLVEALCKGIRREDDFHREFLLVLPA